MWWSRGILFFLCVLQPAYSQDPPSPNPTTFLAPCGACIETQETQAGRVISYNTLVQGHLDPRGEKDTYFFDGASGDHIDLRVLLWASEGGKSVSLTIEQVDTDDRIAQSQVLEPHLMRLFLRKSGRFRIEVADVAGAGGSYSLCLRQINQPIPDDMTTWEVTLGPQDARTYDLETPQGFAPTFQVRLIDKPVPSWIELRGDRGFQSVPLVSVERPVPLAGSLSGSYKLTVINLSEERGSYGVLYKKEVAKGTSGTVSASWKARIGFASLVILGCSIVVLLLCLFTPDESRLVLLTGGIVALGLCILVLADIPLMTLLRLVGMQDPGALLPRWLGDLAASLVLTYGVYLAMRQVRKAQQSRRS